MKNYKVVPLKGVDPILLGMSRDEVHAVLGDQFESFTKVPNAQHPTDAWHENAFQVFYGGALPTVEYIELSSSDSFAVHLFGQSVFDLSAPDLVNCIQTHAAVDSSDPELGFSYIFPTLELSVWRPTQQDLHFATIGIGEAGYYSAA